MYGEHLLAVSSLEAEFAYKYILTIV